MIKAVIFDHDGTLVDSEGRHFDLWREVVEQFGVDFSAQEYIAEHSGIPTLQNAQVLVDKYRLPINASQLYSLKEQKLKQSLNAEAFPLIPGVIECMQSFKDAGLLMAIATGAGIQEISSSTAAYGFDHYITYSATSDQVKHGKPAPDVYLLAAEKLGVAPEQCIAIEDSNNGLQAALAAGMECLIVRNPWSAAHSYNGATVIFDSILDAQTWVLDRLN